MPVVLEDLDVDTGPIGPSVVLGGLDVRTVTGTMQVVLGGLTVSAVAQEPEPDPEDPDAPLTSVQDTVTITVIRDPDEPLPEGQPRYTEYVRVKTIVDAFVSRLDADGNLVVTETDGGGPSG